MKFAFLVEEQPMILSAKINSLGAEFELNYTNNTWNLPPASAKWGGVMYSDRGPFEVKPWGVVWLMDGMGSTKKSCSIILHEAPTDEKNMPKTSGTGRAFAPATPGFKDAEVEWRVVRPSA